jgi:hypothetical protein
MTQRDTSDSEAARLLLRLMDDTYSDWRTGPTSRLTMAEQEAREFLLRRQHA